MTENLSPKPIAVAVRKEYDFFEALKQVKKGDRITKLEWNDPTIQIFLFNDRLKIRKGEELFDLVVSAGDMEGSDWITV